VPDKCFWYLIDQLWHKDHWVYKTNQQVSVTVAVVNDCRNLVTILQLKPHEAQEILGVDFLHMVTQWLNLNTSI